MIVLPALAASVIRTVGCALASVNFMITFVLNIGWMIICVKRCCIVLLKYRLCKQTLNLHPTYRYIEYQSQQGELYNLKTSIVKYVLIVMCLGVEISILLMAGAYSMTADMHIVDPNIIAKWVKIVSHYPHCQINIYFILLYEFPFYFVICGSGFSLFFLLFVLLSILTRYLAARYLNHPFKLTLFNYIIWFGFQLVIVAICSNIYTFVITPVVYPFLLIVNWFVLLRDNLKLSRILRFNLREIKLHSNNKALYREQLYAFRFYRLFQKLMLISLFLFVALVVIDILLNSFTFIYLNSFCFFNVLYGLDYNPNIEIPIPHYIFDNFYLSSEAIILVLLVLHSFSTSLPLLCVTVIQLFRACVKGYKSRHFVYRFNYENIDQPLMSGYRE